MYNNIKKFGPLISAALLATPAFGQTPIRDDFTQAVNTNDWVPLGSPTCLTAGTSALQSDVHTNNYPNGSNIPGCNYTNASGINKLDAPGSGALRLTAAANTQHGA